jgi:hypothetical protein
MKQQSSDKLRSLDDMYDDVESPTIKQDIELALSRCGGADRIPIDKIERDIDDEELLSRLDEWDTKRSRQAASELIPEAAARIRALLDERVNDIIACEDWISKTVDARRANKVIRDRVTELEAACARKGNEICVLTQENEELRKVIGKAKRPRKQGTLVGSTTK